MFKLLTRKREEQYSKRHYHEKILKENIVIKLILQSFNGLSYYNSSSVCVIVNFNAEVVLKSIHEFLTIVTDFA